MCEWMSKAQKEECNGCTSCCIYKALDEKPYYDKKDHFERSLAHQSNHKRHNPTPDKSFIKIGTV